MGLQPARGGASAVEIGRSALDGLMRRAAGLDYLRKSVDLKREGGGKVDKGEAAATEYKVRGYAAEPSRTTCDDQF